MITAHHRHLLCCVKPANNTAVLSVCLLFPFLLMQVAGLRFFHRSGTFLSAALLNADGTTSPISPSAKYTVVSTDYLLQGGDGFNFKGADVLQPAGSPYAELVIDDLKLFPDGVSVTAQGPLGGVCVCACVWGGMCER